MRWPRRRIAHWWVRRWMVWVMFYPGYLLANARYLHRITVDDVRGVLAELDFGDR